MTITLASEVVASRQQVSADLAGEAVILSLTNGVYYGLDPVAARIWELVQERRTVASVRDALLDEFEGVDEERCTRDLVEFLTQLRDWELLEVSPEQGPSGA